MSNNPNPDIPEGHVFIGDLPAAVVLAALYNNAAPKDTGSRTAFNSKMTIRNAERILGAGDTPIAHEIFGRFIGVDPHLFSFDPSVYDEANLADQPIKAKHIIDNVRALLDLAIQDYKAGPHSSKEPEKAGSTEYTKSDSLAEGNLMGDFVSPLGAAIAKARESVKPNRRDQAVANVERARIESTEEALTDGPQPSINPRPTNTEMSDRMDITHKPSGSYPRGWHPH